MRCLRFISRKRPLKSYVMLAVSTILAFQAFIVTAYVFLDSTMIGTLWSDGRNETTVELRNLHQEKILSDPADVMILTYIRSGSTFIGRILGHRHDTYYWYEPLWKTHKFEYIAQNGSICKYGAPSCKAVPESATQSWIQTREFLLSLYTCKYLDSYKNRLALGIQGNTYLAGKTGTDLRSCLTTKRNTCFPEIMKNCTAAKHRASKVLRIDTAHAQYLLDNLPRFKIIQVLRDPRAVIYSRKKENWFYNKRVTPYTDAQTLCTRMDDDLEAARNLQKLYPDRVKIIQYEDFYDPFRTASKLYSFLNMEMTQYEETMLNSINSSDANYGFHPDKYRNHLPWGVNEAVNKHCRSILHKLGLRVFENIEELKDMNIDVLLSPEALPYGL